ncbi:uncharacterized protein LOC133202502 [Saccostrea echinata]|uniref:uncharacterized protein LOC133202502 n=1 Tax=Saccostrea echinata TaxID=191078 RepID=UPI002A83D42B|nr:uncharacterized protein LOC133202502 [Saccostrea echinata]
MLLAYLPVTITIVGLLHTSRAQNLDGEPDYTKILYGGVLRVEEHEDSIKESQDVIQFAVFFVKRRYPICETPKKESRKVSTVEKLTLFYTNNEEIPYLVNVSGTFQPLVFGTLQDFSLWWTCGRNVTLHNFTIATYPKETHHVYSHTFMKVSDLGNFTAPLEVDERLEQRSIEDPCCRKTWIPSDFVMYRCSKSCKLKCVEPFSVMTYNIWNMNTFTKIDQDYPARFRRLAKFVYAPGQLDKYSVYNGKTEEGVAVFSRFPIIAQNTFLLFRNRSNSADLHQRVCLHVTIQHPHHGVIHFLTTHLSLSHEAREESVVQIWRYLRGLRGPVILTGDFNAEPQEKAMRFLRGEVSLKGEKTSCLVDVWPYVYPKSHGFTFNSAEGKLKKRIDYIFKWNLDKDFQVSNVEIDQHSGKGQKAASDHLPVVATFC